MSTLPSIHAVATDPHYEFQAAPAQAAQKTLVVSNLVRKKARTPTEIRFETNLASDSIIFNEQWKSYALVVTFEENDAQHLQLLEERIFEPILSQTDPGQTIFDDTPEDWEQKRFFTAEGTFDHFLKLKTEPNGKKFKPTFNIPLVPNKETKDLYVGQTVTLRASLFFWYSTNSGADGSMHRCGLSLKVTEMHFKQRPRLVELEDHSETEEVSTPTRKRKQVARPSPAPTLALPPPAVRVSNGTGTRKR